MSIGNIEVTGTTPAKITIDQRMEFRIVDECLRRVFEIPRQGHSEAVFVNGEGALVHVYDVPCGSHSMEERKALRRATDVDHAVLTVLNELRRRQ